MEGTILTMIKRFINKRAARVYCDNTGIPYGAIRIRKPRRGKPIVTIDVNKKVSMKPCDLSKGSAMDMKTVSRRSKEKTTYKDALFLP